jgi:hypothetical protein
MSPVLMVVEHVASHQPFEMPLSAHQPAEEVSERHDHGKDSSGKIRFQSLAKSFILQVYDVLARHNRTTGVNA